MSSKIFVFVAFLAVARAGVITPGVSALVDNNYDNSHYTFGYSVDDPFTGDSKAQVETRIGGNVQGSYSLNDPDGTRRTVDYTADDVNGFNAVVRKTPLVRTAHVVAPLVQTRVAPVANAVSHVANVSPLVNVASVKPVAKLATVSHVAAPVSTYATSSIVSDVGSVKSVSNIAHVAPVVSNVISEDTVEVGSPVAHLAEVANVAQVAPVTVARVVPETRITETANSVVHNVPYSYSTYSVPFRQYSYSPVPYSYGLVNPAYFSSYPSVPYYRSIYDY